MRDHSRVILLGSRASDTSMERLKDRLDRSTMHVTVDPSIVGAALTLAVLVTTLRRMPGTVSLDPRDLPEELVRGLMESGRRIDSSRGIVLASTPPVAAVHLRVGTEPATATAIRVVPDGYGAHVARDPAVKIRVARPAHPLGAVYAAALGAAETFKDIAGVREERRVDHEHLTWCPVALSADLTLAPMRAGSLHVDLALAGCGAIGTAIAVILAELDAEGSILLIDRQRFARENVATYSIGDERNARGRPWKVNLIGRHLRRLHTRRFHGDVATLPAAVDAGELPWPRLVLAGLDSIPARHDLQRLWPDRLIDAGTSDTAVGLHDVVAGQGPCIMCFLPARTEASAVVGVASETGLTVERLGRGDEILRPEDLEQLTPQQQTLLRPHLGRPVCGLANALRLVGVDDGYEPAVPFVAQQAACLAVGRLLAIELGMHGLPNFVEYDGLIGPRSDAVDVRLADPSCYCQQRAELIGRVRQERRRRTGG